MEDLDKMVNGKIKCRTKELKNPMGICGVLYEKGLPWDRSKIRAMQNEYNDDHIVVSLQLFIKIISNQIDLTEEEQIFI